MNWQKHARLGIVAFVILFAATVIIAWRQRKSPPPESAAVHRTDPAAVVEDQGGLYEHFKEGKLVFSIRSTRQLTYADGRSKLLGVTLTLPDRGGRTIEVQADEANVVRQAGQEIGTARLDGNVRLKTSDGITMTAGHATYNDADGVLSVPGPVQFQRGRMVGPRRRDDDRNRACVELERHGDRGARREGAEASRQKQARRLARAEHSLATGTGGANQRPRIEGNESPFLKPADQAHTVDGAPRQKPSCRLGPGGGRKRCRDDLDLKYARMGSAERN